MASQMIFGVSVPVHLPKFLELQTAITALTLGAEAEAETKVPCKLGGLTYPAANSDVQFPVDWLNRRSGTRVS
jgi:hypothetical protein